MAPMTEMYKVSSKIMMKVDNEIVDFIKVEVLKEFPQLSEYTFNINKIANALEKQIPKKPIINDGLCGGYDDNKDYVCPICGAMVYELDCDGYYQILYPTCYCGQRIDWSDNQ